MSETAFRHPEARRLNLSHHHNMQTLHRLTYATGQALVSPSPLIWSGAVVDEVRCCRFGD